MRKLVCILLFLLHAGCLCVMAAATGAMSETGGLPAEAVVAVADTVSADTVSVRENRLQRIKSRVRQRIKEKLSEPFDTVRDSRYWWRALKHGKVDFTGGTIDYPRFINFCWKAYKWGDHAFNSYDTAYVKSTGKNWKFIVKNNNWLDSYAGRPFDDDIWAFMHSDLTANVGVQLSFMAVSVGYTACVTNLVHGEKVSKKVDFTFTCARFSADAFLFENHGKCAVDFTQHGHNVGHIGRFSGLHRKAYGVSANYFLNHNHYAHAAAYCYSKYQRRSAGSVLVGINIQHHDMSFDTEQMPAEIRSLVVPGSTSLPGYLYNDYCVSAGYGFNWVLGRQWLLNVTVTPYVGYRQMLATEIEEKASAWSLNSTFRMGLVYNHRQFFLGLQGYVDLHRYKSAEHHFIYAIEDFSLLAGVRF
ncbi:MAG: DUF4421 domain-containing protein [Muribaculaceae bacterium]|nr:DUF4421 domain-containing protein [Muribaculaceae bacterium]